MSMRLVTIKYSEHDGEPKEWDIDPLNLNPVNLIVGKNASGKTRALNIIHGLARLIRGELKPVFQSANFDAIFEYEDRTYEYSIHILNNALIKEQFKKEDKVLLHREESGKGSIYFEKDDKSMDFQAPPTELALVMRQDSVQHSYFQPLHDWARAVYFYAFGTFLGRENYWEFSNVEHALTSSSPPIWEISNKVGPILKDGIEKYGENFKKNIQDDLSELDYHIADINVAKSEHLIAPGRQLYALWIKEKDVSANIEQVSISQGMFRVISLLIQVNYSIMAHKPSCIIIDDIGEGLDFERSCALIKLLIEKVKHTDIQLIMSTNDRFVMNNVPLEMWHIIHRAGSHCKIFNIKNHPDVFDDFRFTGLNNFDFFASNYFTDEKK
jgi:energy-coupling factor transporter ATP-binding protein EcfA2